MATYDVGGDPGSTREVDAPGLLGYTHVMYALHALTIVIGIVTPAFIVTAFLFGIPSIIAVIMNYARRGDARGTWLESHFRWQLRTFWIVALVVALAWIAFGWLVLIFIGLIPIFIICGLAGLWAAYRIIRGWLALNARKPLPV
jgi:uncharacterized membrane protein